MIDSICVICISREVTTFLKENYEGSWIGRNGPVALLDLNPLHFFLLYGMKSRMYHGSKIEGEHEPLEATHEADDGASNWHTFSGNIQWRKDWQHAECNGGHSKLVL
jgi:hypothetical protein